MSERNPIVTEADLHAFADGLLPRAITRGWKPGLPKIPSKRI